MMLALAIPAAVACGSTDSNSGGPTPSSGFKGLPDRGDGGKSRLDGGVSDPGPTFNGDPDSGHTVCSATTTKAEKALVDIIFVIDNSGSMTEETVQIKQNINSFAASIESSGLDFRVIILANRGTGALQICAPPPLGGPSCADNAPKFFQVDQDVESTDSLSLILSTYDNVMWGAHLRLDAYKIFVEITDDESYVTSDQFDKQLLAKLPAGMFGTATNRKYVFDSIIGWKEGTTHHSPGNQCTTAVNIGDQYQKLSDLTGGIVDSICKTDFSPVLDNLAKGVISRLGCEFAMPKAADGKTVDPGSVVVEYTSGTAPTVGKKIDLTQVTDATKCAATPNAWYYDAPKPTKILLCPETCKTAGQDTSGKMELLAGCQAPPPR